MTDRDPGPGSARLGGALARAWRRALPPDAPREAARRALDDLVARYGEPHRAYHTLAHVRQVLDDVDALVAADADADAGADPGADADADAGADPVAIRLAAWYHDAVYDPRAAHGANEAASAHLATAALPGLGVPPERVARVAALVLATTDHVADTPDAAVLVDADLAILAAPPGAYATYARAVRAEYAWLDDDAWRSGRASVLTRLLAREPIYTTAVMRHRGETTARANLRAELRALRAGRIP